MKLIKILILFFLISLSSVVFADTYTAHNLYCPDGPGVCNVDPYAACSSVANSIAKPNPTASGFACYTSTDSFRWILTASPSCPYGGTVSGTSCINVPACSAGQVRNSVTGACQTPPVCSSGAYDNPTNSCIGPSVCTGTQTPLTANCKLPTDKGMGINCANGTTVYAPSVCPPTGSRWSDIFPAPKHMCSPLDTDHTKCTPTLFQRIDDFASSHAIQYATAALALMSIPAIALAPEIAGVISGVSVEARAIWDGVFHNSAGEIVDVKVAGDVPTSVMGESLADFIKNNPTSPYSSQFPEAYNNAAPQAPIVVEPNTGVIHPVDSTVPLSPNQIWDAAKHVSTTVQIPYSEIAPFIMPENIPWIVEAQAPIKYDIQHMDSPVNYPELTRVREPLQSMSPYFQISPNPLDPAPFFPAATPQSITGIQPFTIFSPSTPVPVSAPIPSTTRPPAQYNPNPTGTDSPVSPYTPPPPNTSIDPNAPDLPPVPPTIYPDTFKYFDWLPMSNPFTFNARDYLPSLPEPTCYYEIHRTFHVPLLGEKHFDLAPCAPLQPLRTVLAWVFSVLTLFTCFFIIFRSSF